MTTSHMQQPKARFWKDKTVLITGHTGFKGSWLTLWLNKLGAKVSGIGLPPVTTPNLFEIAKIEPALQNNHFSDIRNAIQLKQLIWDIQPEIILHLAAQPLVRASYQQPLDTFSTNVMGTANLLEALRGLESVKSVVMITTDKVYKNREWLWPYRETDELGGHDPYSASKAASELVIAGYRDAFLAEQGISVATARAGNVIGGGDWSEDRLIPDAVRAWTSGTPLHIRRPDAVRPWQHVLEPLHGYLRLAESLFNDISYAGAYNFGPSPQDAASVRSIINLARDTFGQGEIVYEDGKVGPHEAGLLALDNSKSHSVLDIKPKWTLSETVRRTMNWYRMQAEGQDCTDLCHNEIEAYEDAL